MKKIATLAILLILFVGFAGATMPNPTYNFGPQSGIKVQALEVANDAQVKGNLYCNGTTVVDGAITSDTTIGAGSDLTAVAGSGVFNWAVATGFFNTSTGTNYINGNVIQATLKNYTMQGASTFTSGTGAFDVNGAMTAKGITQDSGSSLAQSGAAGITVGTTGITASVSPIKLLENVTLAANKSLTGLSGSGAVDLSAMTGGYSSPLGTNTFNGNILGAGLTTTTTGDGAVTLKGNTTVYTDKALAVTTADKLTVAGVIVPSEMVITVPITKTDFAAGELNRTIFIADDAWTITSIEEVHSVAETTATTLPLAVQKITGTQALTGGINITNGALDLKSTANTVVTAALSTTIGGTATGRTTLADGNRIGIICNLTGTAAMGEFRAGLLTIHMKRA